MCLTFLLRNSAARLPNKPGFIIDNRRLSYSELNSQAKKLALRLIAAGVGSGDRVALHMYNGPKLMVACFACFYAGAIAVPINTRMRVPEIAYVLDHSDSSIYLGQSELFQPISESRSCFPRVRQFVVDEVGPEVSADRLSAAEFPAIAPNQPAVILGTLDSGARSRSVVHSHISARNAARDFKVREDDVVTIATPMVHSAGFFTALASVDAGATAVAVAQFDAEAVLDLIDRHHGTYLLGMPVMYRALIAAQKQRRRDVDSGRVFFAGGDAVTPALQRDFARCFGQPLHEAFETTETGLLAANWPGIADRIGSFGRAVPGMEVG